MDSVVKRKKYYILNTVVITSFLTYFMNRSAHSKIVPSNNLSNILSFIRNEKVLVVYCVFIYTKLTL